MNSNFKEILKKCFGKQKDEKYHAVAMLAIYGIFVFILILAVRINAGSIIDDTDDNTNSDIQAPITTVSPTQTPEQETNLTSINSYTYTSTITYNGISEVFIGKRYANKQKFSYIKDSNITEYGLVNNEYFKQENGIYTQSSSPSRHFKYCDVNKIFTLIQNKTPIENKYQLSNKEMITTYDDMISIDTEQPNTITINKENSTIKSIDLDYSNYISSLEGTSLTLIIHIELSDINNTSDFEINVL